jgi:hypothetical protein
VTWDLFTDDLIPYLQVLRYGLIDATWAPDYGTYYDNYCSITGYAISGNTDGSNLLSWTANRQPIVALSSSESGWYAASEAAKEAAYVSNLFADLDLPNHA